MGVGQIRTRKRRIKSMTQMSMMTNRQMEEAKTSQKQKLITQQQIMMTNRQMEGTKTKTNQRQKLTTHQLIMTLIKRNIFTLKKKIWM